MGFFSQRGYGRFAAAGDGQDPRVVGDIAFANPMSGMQWVGTAGMYQLHSNIYTPVSRDIVSAAQLQWERLENHIALNTPSAGRAQDRLVRLRTALVAPVKLVDSLAGSSEYQLMASAFRSISDLVAQFGRESWADPQEQLEAADAKAAADADAATAAAAKAAADRATAAAKSQKTQAAISAAQAAIADAERARLIAQRSAATAAEKGGTSPLVIAAIAVPVLGVLAYAFSRRGKSMSGYRRRRHR